ATHASCSRCRPPTPVSETCASPWTSPRPSPCARLPSVVLSVATRSASHQSSDELSLDVVGLLLVDLAPLSQFLQLGELALDRGWVVGIAFGLLDYLLGEPTGAPDASERQSDRRREQPPPRSSGTKSNGARGPTRRMWIRPACRSAAFSTAWSIRSHASRSAS